MKNVVPVQELPWRDAAYTAICQCQHVIPHMLWLFKATEHTDSFRKYLQEATSSQAVFKQYEISPRPSVKLTSQGQQFRKETKVAYENERRIFPWWFKARNPHLSERTATAPCTQPAFRGQPHCSPQQPQNWKVNSQVLIKASTLCCTKISLSIRDKTKPQYFSLCANWSTSRSQKGKQVPSKMKYTNLTSSG